MSTLGLSSSPSPSPPSPAGSPVEPPPPVGSPPGAAVCAARRDTQSVRQRTDRALLPARLNPSAGAGKQTASAPCYSSPRQTPSRQPRRGRRRPPRRRWSQRRRRRPPRWRGSRPALRQLRHRPLPLHRHLPPPYRLPTGAAGVRGQRRRCATDTRFIIRGGRGAGLRAQATRGGGRRPAHRDTWRTQW